LGLPTPLGRVKRGMFQPLEAGFLNEWQLGVKRTCQQQVRKFGLNQLRRPSQTTLWVFESASWPLIILVIMTSTICGI
jgi:hypothetical protein